MRWLKAIVSAGSLLVSLLSAGLWVWSKVHPAGEFYRAWYDPVSARYGHNAIGVAPGLFYLATARLHYPDRAGQVRMERNLEKGVYAGGWSYRTSTSGYRPNSFRPPLNGWEQHGFMFRRTPYPPPGLRGPVLATGHLMNVWVPLWVPTVIGLVAPVLWLMGMLRRRRLARKGLCAECGYDLRGSPDRCPECGRPVNAQVEHEKIALKPEEVKS